MLFNNKVSIERDNNNKKLEENIFSKLAEIVQPFNQEPTKQNNIKFVSIEDALRELIELEKNKPGN